MDPKVAVALTLSLVGGLSTSLGTSIPLSAILCVFTRKYLLIYACQITTILSRNFLKSN